MDGTWEDRVGLRPAQLCTLAMDNPTGIKSRKRRNLFEIRKNKSNNVSMQLILSGG